MIREIRDLNFEGLFLSYVDAEFCSQILIEKRLTTSIGFTYFALLQIQKISRYSSNVYPIFQHITSESLKISVKYPDTFQRRSIHLLYPLIQSTHQPLSGKHDRDVGDRHLEGAEQGRGVGERRQVVRERPRRWHLSGDLEPAGC